MSEEDTWSRWLSRRWMPFNWRFFRDFDDVFGEMEDLMASRFKELSENVPKDLVRERTLPSGAKVKEWGPFVYGYSITVGPDGKPKIREFGNIKPRGGMRRPQLDVREEREPLADVMSTDGEVKVIIELPGVVKENIKLRGTKETLTVSVDTPHRKYYKKLELPAKVNPKSAKSNYMNGVLEVTIEKTKKEELEGEELKIE